MIAIPNMEKPKDCSECILADKHLNGLYEAKYYCRLEADSCPLIEIDLERDIPTVWYNRQTEQYEPKGTKQEVYERLYKLKNGEGRADDVRHNEQQDF